MLSRNVTVSHAVDVGVNLCIGCLKSCYLTNEGWCEDDDNCGDVYDAHGAGMNDASVCVTV